MPNNNFTLKDDIQEKLELYELTQDKIGIDITNFVLFNTIQQSKYFNHNNHFAHTNLLFLDNKFHLSHITQFKEDGVIVKLIDYDKDYPHNFVSFELNQDGKVIMFDYDEHRNMSNVKLFISDEQKQSFHKINHYVEQVLSNREQTNKLNDTPIPISEYDFNLYKKYIETYDDNMVLKGKYDKKLKTTEYSLLCHGNFCHYRNDDSSFNIEEEKNKYNEKFGFGSINNPNITGFTLNHIPDIVELKHPVFNHNQVNKLTGILIGELVSKYDKLFEKIQLHQDLKFDIVNLSDKEFKLLEDVSYVSKNQILTSHDKYSGQEYLFKEYFNPDKFACLNNHPNMYYTCSESTNQLYGVKYLDINNYNLNNDYDKLFITMRTKQNDFIGYMAIARNEEDKGSNIWKINTIGIKSQFRGLGLTNELYKKMQEFAELNHLIICRNTMSLSEDGQKKLVNKLNKDDLKNFHTLESDYDFFEQPLGKLLYHHLRQHKNIDCEQFIKLSSFISGLDKNENGHIKNNHKLDKYLSEHYDDLSKLDYDKIKQICVDDELNLSKAKKLGI